MNQMDFSPEEVTILREVLDSTMEQLDVEIHRTDSPTFKHQLQQRHDVLERLMSKLTVSPAFAE